MRRLVTAGLVLLFATSHPGGSQAPPPLPSDELASVRELRLGMICYGGVSLAIYMFGLTRELHHLVLASEALERDARARPEGGVPQAGAARAELPPSARPYYDFLSRRWQQERVRTRVSIDVISGTSAGGINGIVLAKALAHNRSLVGLRRLWFEEADISRLATFRPWPLSSLWNLLRRRPALGGDNWLRELYKALEMMDRTAATSSPSLVPPDSPLELRVTATNYYGSHRLLEIGDPPTSVEAEHAHVFTFRFDRDNAGGIARSDFDQSWNPALAFAARSSASFPVAFPPVNLTRLPGVLGRNDLDVDRLAQALFPHQVADNAGGAAAVARQTFLIDGGVLDNYPFGIAFQRLSRRTAGVEVDRVLIFLEPDPHAPALPSETEPNSWQTLLAASASIPGAEPIGRDLRDIESHNERVSRVLDIVRENEARARGELVAKGEAAPPQPLAGGGAAAARSAPSVAAQVERTLTGRVGTLAEPADMARDLARRGPPPGAPREGAVPPELALIRAMRQEIEADAARELPLVQEGYQRLRVHSVLDQLARVLGTALCELPEEHEGLSVSLLRQIVVQWAVRRGLTAGPDGGAIRAADRADFIAGYDVGYLRRNLRFVSDWLNDQYPPLEQGQYDYGLTRAELDRARLAVANQVEALTAALRGKELPRLLPDPALLKGVHDALCVPFDPKQKQTPKQQAAAIVAAQAARLDAFVDTLGDRLERFQDKVRSDLYREFVAQTVDWSPEARRAVLARYLGFPYWDRLAYPYTAFSGVGELRGVAVVRFSPKDVTALSTQGAKKLSGSGLGHFGAFFSRRGREKDYLWGRLDGAERALGLVGGAPADRTSLFTAILEEETADGEVSSSVLGEIRLCIQHPGSC